MTLDSLLLDMPEPSANWTFLTNHSHVLLSIWHRPDIKVREIAQIVGITALVVEVIGRELRGYMTAMKSIY